ncbi:MAG: iron(III) transport system ATP-binding protein [Solirubrobacteraceae bacterium]|nr:iron(III) transport system ATP-binding protein [Solirubrobacteraceae bacterium]
MNAPAALSVRGVAKAFGAHPVLEGLDLDVPAGGFMAVLGPSGCGKTTLLRLIAGFEHVDAGAIAVEGREVSSPRVHVAPERRGVGFVPQEGALFPHLDAAANIAFGLPRAERRGARVHELLELVGLAGLGARRVHELSGGQQQRVALARALAPEPGMVLLDEPFSALDPALRASLRADVQAALRAAGTTALLVTHDQVEALSLADQVGILRDGRLVQTADPATLYREPVDAEIARFLGEAVLLPALVADGHAQCALGRLALCWPRDAGPATAMIRPEQIVINGARGGVRARVLATTFYGHDATIQLALVGDGERSCTVTARTRGHAVPAVGEIVDVAVEGEVAAYAGAAASPASDWPAGAVANG